jgi:hypothetical protein
MTAVPEIRCPKTVPTKMPGEDALITTPQPTAERSIGRRMSDGADDKIADYIGGFARACGRAAVTDRQPNSAADTAVDCRVRHSQGGDATRHPPGARGGHQRRLRKQQRLHRSRLSCVPAFLDQAGMLAERLRQHA